MKCVNQKETKEYRQSFCFQPECPAALVLSHIPLHPPQRGAVKEALQKKSRHCLHGGARTRTWRLSYRATSRTCPADKISVSPTTSSSREFVCQRRIAVTLMTSSNCASFVQVEHAHRLFLSCKRDQKQRNSSNGCFGTMISCHIWETLSASNWSALCVQAQSF